MYNGEAINDLIPSIKPFPPSSAVFIDSQLWLENHLLPLFSIDLGELRPEFAGVILHMVSPCEGGDGYIGSRTEPCHNQFCGKNFFSFRLTADNHYEFLAQECYFDDPNNNDKVFIQDKNERIEKFLGVKKRFEQTGELSWQRRNNDIVKLEPILYNVDGEFSISENWVSNFRNANAEYDEFDIYNRPPSEAIQNMAFYHYECETMYFDENPFIKVGTADTSIWCDYSPHVIMFYEPISRIVLFTTH